MTEKWLGDDESVLMDAKSFVWLKTSFILNGTWALLYLTNRRLYVKDRLFRYKVLEFPFHKIREIESDEKYLTVVGDYKGTECRIKIKQKNIDEMWESMIKNRMMGKVDRS